MNQSPNSTLAVLVTCSRDETRRDMAVEVVKNLAEQIPLAGLQDSFLIFDNASTYREHLNYAPAGSIIIQSPENSGYWSAINYILNNYRLYFERDYEFIYLIESDLLHHDLHELSECENFLRRTPSAACVRTQEFSVAMRWRYDKSLQFLPFHVHRSEISLQNLVTKERAWFKKDLQSEKIYLSNLHAKLPALNRMEALRSVFPLLGKRGDFSEADFFADMNSLYPHIGVYDGGLFHSIFDRKSHVSGSYSSSKTINAIGYQPTRAARLVSVSENLTVRKE